MNLKFISLFAPIVFLSVNLSECALAHRINDTFIRIDANSTCNLEVEVPKKLILSGSGHQADQAAAELITKGVSVVSNYGPCEFQLQPLVSGSSDSHLIFGAVVHCEKSADILNVSYDLFFDLDKEHRAYLIFEKNQTIKTAVLSPEVKTFTVGEHSENYVSFAAFVWEGVWHIWIGLDHVLFLLTLLLPAVMVLNNKKWAPQAKFSNSLTETFKIVTGFTVAHSVTLVLAGLKIIELESWFVESAVAFSVLIVSLNNVFNFLPGPHWKFAAFFGLVHGLGFAAVLGDLGLTNKNMFLTLLGFNIGVELGQLAIVVVLVPVFFGIRQFKFYQRYILIGGSSACAVISVCWIVDRIGQFNYLPF